MRLPSTHKGRVTGFTLVEMAIVLVIIGIILAGVMKGRDIVRGSQVKQFTQGFASKWVTIASTYYDKTGQQLYDGTANGGTAANVDGLMDRSFVALGTGDGDSTAVIDTLRSVGIDPCTLIKTDLNNDTTSTNQCPGSANVFFRTVDGEVSGKTITNVGFYNLQLTTALGTTTRNCIILRNVPSDVAIGVDTVVDGIADGTAGACINLQDPTTRTAPGANTQVPGATPALFAWPADPATETLVTTVGLVMDY